MTGALDIAAHARGMAADREYVSPDTLALLRMQALGLAMKWQTGADELTLADAFVLYALGEPGAIGDLVKKAEANRARAAS